MLVNTIQDVSTRSRTSMCIQYICCKDSSEQNIGHCTDIVTVSPRLVKHITKPAHQIGIRLWVSQYLVMLSTDQENNTNEICMRCAVSLLAAAGGCGISHGIR